jgi:hypothetical protein
VQLIIAGRSATSLEKQAQILNEASPHNANKTETLVVDTTTSLEKLQQATPHTVINTCGPFSGMDCRFSYLK